MSRETWTRDWRGGGAYMRTLTKNTFKEFLLEWKHFFVQKDWADIVSVISAFFDKYSDESLTLFLEKSPLQSLRDVKRKIFFAEKDLLVKEDIDKIKKVIECHQVDDIEPFSVVDNRLATNAILASAKKVLCANGILLTHKVVNEKMYQFLAGGGEDWSQLKLNQDDFDHLVEFFDIEKLFAFLQQTKYEDYFFKED